MLYTFQMIMYLFKTWAPVHKYCDIYKSQGQNTNPSLSLRK